MARPKNTSFLRGSFFILSRRCGKPNCHCAHDEPHSSPALSYKVDGSTRIVTLRSQDVRGVKAALARYKKARAQLDKEAQAGNEALRQRIKKEKAGARGRKR